MTNNQNSPEVSISSMSQQQCILSPVGEGASRGRLSGLHLHVLAVHPSIRMSSYIHQGRKEDAALHSSVQRMTKQNSDK